MERVYDGNMGYLEHLAAMGANVKVDGSRAVITGPRLLRGRHLDLWGDIRGSAAMALAGLVAEGETVLDGFEVVRRGYQDLAGDLKSLGASVRTEVLAEAEIRPAATV